MVSMHVAVLFDDTKQEEVIEKVTNKFIVYRMFFV